MDGGVSRKDYLHFFIVMCTSRGSSKKKMKWTAISRLNKISLRLGFRITIGTLARVKVRIASIESINSQNAIGFMHGNKQYYHIQLKIIIIYCHTVRSRTSLCSTIATTVLAVDKKYFRKKSERNEDSIEWISTCISIIHIIDAYIRLTAWELFNKLINVWVKSNFVSSKGSKDICLIQDCISPISLTLRYAILIV